MPSNDTDTKSDSSTHRTIDLTGDTGDDDSDSESESTTTSSATAPQAQKPPEESGDTDPTPKERGLERAQEALAAAEEEAETPRQTVALALDSVQSEIQEQSEQLTEAAQRKAQAEGKIERLEATRDDLREAYDSDSERPIMRVREGGIVWGVTQDDLPEEIGRLESRIETAREQADQLDGLTEELAAERKVGLYALNALREKQQQIDSQFSGGLGDVNL